MKTRSNFKEDLDFFDTPVKNGRLPNGHFAKGNRFWMNDGYRIGTPPKFDTIEDFEEKLKEYLTWCDDNPYEQNEFNGKDAIECTVRKLNSPTMEGFCAFMGSSPNGLYTFAKKNGFEDIVESFSNICFSISYGAAAAGILSPGIVSRKLGLVDKKEVNSNITTKVNLYIPSQVEIGLPALKEGESASSNIEDADWELI